jgi:hypothetical protein
MTANNIWDQLVVRHPSFKDDDNLASLRVRGLRNLIEQAWDEGYDTAVRKSADVFTKSSPLPDIFSKLFKN